MSVKKFIDYVSPAFNIKDYDTKKDDLKYKSSTMKVTATCKKCDKVYSSRLSNIKCKGSKKTCPYYGTNYESLFLNDTDLPKYLEEQEKLFKTEKVEVDTTVIKQIKKSRINTICDKLLANKISKEKFVDDLYSMLDIKERKVSDKSKSKAKLVIEEPKEPEEEPEEEIKEEESKRPTREDFASTVDLDNASVTGGKAIKLNEKVKKPAIFKKV